MHIRNAELRILRYALPVLGYLVAVCGCWADPQVRVGTILATPDSHLKDCPVAEATILAQYLRS